MSTTVEVIAFTQPEQLSPYSDQPFTMPFDRIRAIRAYFGPNKLHSGTRMIGKLEPQTYELPSAMASLLIQAMKIDNDGHGFYNCHHFGKFMTGQAPYDCNVFTPAYVNPRFDVANAVETTGSLAAGVLGVIGQDARGEWAHSVIGLGEDTQNTIQVMSQEGEFGIATMPNLLTYYTLETGRDDTALYQYPDTAS